MCPAVSANLRKALVRFLCSLPDESVGASRGSSVLLQKIAPGNRLFSACPQTDIMAYSYIRRIEYTSMQDFLPRFSHAHLPERQAMPDLAAFEAVTLRGIIKGGRQSSFWH